jgi:hypothetical protein
MRSSGPDAMTSTFAIRPTISNFIYEAHGIGRRDVRIKQYLEQS